MYISYAPLSIALLPYFMCVRSDGSDVSLRIHTLAKPRYSPMQLLPKSRVLVHIVLVVTNSTS